MFLPQYNITMNIFKLNIPEEQQDNTNLNQTSTIIITYGTSTRTIKGRNL